MHVCPQHLSSGAPAGPMIACPDPRHAALCPGCPGSWPSQASWVHRGAGRGLKSGIMCTHCTVPDLPGSLTRLGAHESCLRDQEKAVETGSWQRAALAFGGQGTL